MYSLRHSISALLLLGFFAEFNRCETSGRGQRSKFNPNFNYLTARDAAELLAFLTSMQTTAVVAVSIAHNQAEFVCVLERAIIGTLNWGS